MDMNFEKPSNVAIALIRWQKMTPLIGVYVILIAISVLLLLKDAPLDFKQGIACLGSGWFLFCFAAKGTFLFI